MCSMSSVAFASPAAPVNSFSNSRLISFGVVQLGHSSRNSFWLCRASSAFISARSEATDLVVAD